VPATLVDATLYATADAGSIPAVSTIGICRENALQISCANHHPALAIEAGDAEHGAARVVAIMAEDLGPLRSPRLHRSNAALAGFARVTDGAGFAYLDVDGASLTDPAALARIRALAIPPAWRDVWICPDPLGHLQATGVDAAGRRQYRYHDLWSQQQAHAKFEHMVAFAGTLPTMRERVLGTMRAGHDLDRARVLACSVRLLDVGMFRIGSEVYEKEDGHLGLATIAKTNVSIEPGRAVFDYIGKEGVERVHAVADPCCVEIVGALKRRRGGGDHLLAFREGRAWHQVHAPLINTHLKSLIGDSFSAKNFRTWNGTVLAAVSLARGEADCASERGRRKAIRQATTEVSHLLGNTPAVARGSYIDPRVFDRFLSGWTIAGELRRIEDRGLADEERRDAIELAVLDLLGG
jgi:DNA topoisomerase I